MLTKLIKLLLVLQFLLPRPVFAADEFSLSQNISYTVDQKDNTIVTQEIILTNNYSGIFAKEYTIDLTGVNVSQVNASDESGSILQRLENDSNVTRIHVKFNNPAIGKNKTKKFTLRYNITGLVTTKGTLKEISLPVYQDTGSLTSITLNIPIDYGNLAFASVNPTHNNQNKNQTILRYQNLTSTNQKILLAFGNSQLFDFHLDYHLTNTSDKPTNLEIPIPPDTANQQVVLTEMDPPPNNIISDRDGNWLAQYRLDSATDLDISVRGQAKIFSASLSTTESNQYLQQLTAASKYWPTTDSLIQNIHPNLQTPRDIYNYVTQTLSYNYSQINTAVRKGAKEALLNPNNSLCTEFTDLFITLARAKNIPSREIEGYAYTNNQKIKPLNANADVLHAWPQYWNQVKSAWISIDPTWGKTTNGIDFFNDLDLNHLTFVIHGLNPDYPPPPGSFRKNSNTKTVAVDFATKEIAPAYNQLTLSPIKTKFGEKPRIRISNSNPNAIKNIKISSAPLRWNHTLAILPPFSETIVETDSMSFLQSLFPSNQKIKIDLTYDNSSSPQELQITNLFFRLNITIAAALLIALFSIGGIIITIKISHV